MWVNFSGSPSASKIDLTNGVGTGVELYFPGGWGGNVYSTGLAVLPGAPSSVAVAAGSVGIYDNEVQRPTISNAGATYLAFGASSSTLYGYSNGLSIFSVDSTDRKSTRLNSSHRYISYAVFCLKKKKNDVHHVVSPDTTAYADSHP